MHLVETEADIKALDLTSDKLLITNQTTMSQWDVHDLMELIKEKYPHVEYHQEICLATQVRQEAVSQQAGQADLTIVVGDPKAITQIVWRKCQWRLQERRLTELVISVS